MYQQLHSIPTSMSYARSSSLPRCASDVEKNCDVAGTPRIIASSFHGMVSKDFCVDACDGEHDQLRTRTPSPEQVCFSRRYSVAAEPWYTDQYGEQMSYPLILPTPNFVTTACPTLYLMPNQFWHSYPVADEKMKFEQKEQSSVTASASSDKSTLVHTDEALASEGTSVAVFADKQVTQDDAPSRGSIGHPVSCAAACKYIKKERGCKDFDACPRCHLCVFRRSKPKKLDRKKKAQERHESDASDG